MIAIQVDHEDGAYTIPGSATREIWEHVEHDVAVLSTEPLKGWGTWTEVLHCADLEGNPGLVYFRSSEDCLCDVYSREPGRGWTQDGIWGGEYARHLTAADAEEACAHLAAEYPDCDWGYSEGPEFPITVKHQAHEDDC